MIAQRPTTLRVLRGNHELPALAPDDELIRFDELRSRIRREGWWQSWRSYPEVVVHTHRSDVITHPFLTRALIKYLSRGRGQIVDEGGSTQDVTLASVLRHAFGSARDLAAFPWFQWQNQKRVRRLQQEFPRQSPNRRPDSPALYLRTDPWFGLTAGGSLGHIAGVLNHLGDYGPNPVFVSTDTIPGVAPTVTTHVVPPPQRYRDVPRALGYWCDRLAHRLGMNVIQDRQPGFVYARYALGSTAGLELALSAKVPFVLEFNGSEIWIQENWGDGLPAQLELARAIEALNLEAADLIVVVSHALREQLEARGVSPEKILVNPNGVDVDRFHPEIDGEPLRQQLDLGAATVVGFIGTFGPWHGAEILAQAWHQVARQGARLLWIGDGAARTQVERIISETGVSDSCRFVGSIPQEEAPTYLAACDILVSPHVPNADGSEFFGSPTKLFEYMAMGRGIVASDLAQLGEVLTHEANALLVPPGDPTALATAVSELIDDPELRQQLGQAARTAAVQHHTWHEHTGKIMSHVAMKPVGKTS